MNRRTLLNSRTALTMSAVLVTATLMLTTGCASSPDDVSYRGITRNLTPELMTTHERSIDVDRNFAATRNIQRRMFWEDLGRVFYTDNHSRLHPAPTVYTSGNPR